jgi:RNA polymerase-binding transcription factor DksA
MARSTPSDPAPRKAASPAKKAAPPAKSAAPAKKAAPVKKAAPAKDVAKKAPAKETAKKAAPAQKAAAAQDVAKNASAPAAQKAAPAKDAAKKAPAATKAAPPAKADAVALAKTAEPAKKAAPAAKPAAPKTVKRTADMERFFESQKVLLLEERETYTRQATTLRAEADQLALDREPGDVQFDEESGQGDTMNVERERDLALSAQALAAVEEIDRAMTKIVDGTYGICERCGTNIPRERLKALPYAALCVQCKSGGLSRR